jgi:hypothetical protein
MSWLPAWAQVPATEEPDRERRLAELNKICPHGLRNTDREDVVALLLELAAQNVKRERERVATLKAHRRYVEIQREQHALRCAIGHAINRLGELLCSEGVTS